jgi:hypothetical protein
VARRVRQHLEPALDLLLGSAMSPDPSNAPDTPEKDSAAGAERIPLFGGRARAKALAAELAELKQRVDGLDLLSVAELDSRKRQLTQDTANLDAALAADREAAKAKLATEIATDRAAAEVDMTTIRAERDRVATESASLESTLAAEREAANAKLAAELAAKQAATEADLRTIRAERDLAAAKRDDLRREIVVTEETAILQEVGLYEYRHPLTDAVAYQAVLKGLQDQGKAMARKDGGAVLAATTWTVNNSAAQGRAMVSGCSKLVLRAYNAEADNLVRGMKPYKLATTLDRLTKAASTIERLGRTMNIRISPTYHALRVRELELTADYLAKRAEEKEREGAERERLREERRVQQELARERARLEKEHEHYSNVIQRLIEQGKHDAAQEHQAVLSQIAKAIEDVDYRVANVRAGYVYVISNVGAFGDQMIKVGLTRRIDPTERVRELGDASVPFRYDTHALVFSDDAVGLEAKMHARLAEKRVNWVNRRREFFYVSPGEAKQHLIELAGELLEYTEDAEAVEYRQSLNHARAVAAGHVDPQQVPESDIASLGLTDDLDDE